MGNTASKATQPHYKMGQYNSFCPLRSNVDFSVAPPNQKAYRSIFPPLITDS
jgi:hypothetical protein